MRHSKFVHTSMTGGLFRSVLRFLNQLIQVGKSSSTLTFTSISFSLHFFFMSEVRVHKDEKTNEMQVKEVGSVGPQHTVYKAPCIRESLSTESLEMKGGDKVLRQQQRSSSTEHTRGRPGRRPGDRRPLSPFPSPEETEHSRTGSTKLHSICPRPRHHWKQMRPSGGVPSEQFSRLIPSFQDKYTYSGVVYAQSIGSGSEGTESSCRQQGGRNLLSKLRPASW